MQIITEKLVSKTIKKRASNTHKGSFGRVLTVGGNAQFGGAIILSSSAAVYSGCGLVTTATDPTNFASLHARLPEAMVIDFNAGQELTEMLAKVDAVVIGPGLGEDAKALQTLTLVFKTIRAEQILIIDGSAIDLIASHHLALPNAKLIFTPHEMEWQRLSGIPIGQQSEAKNKVVQQELNGIVVLKKHHTEIYTDEKTFQLHLGGPEMATGGMGDTLTGMIAAFSTQFSSELVAAVVSATYVHSFIADQLGKTQYVTLPHQIIEHIPQAMAHFAASKTNA
ncbi:NAD(P)H-hydrate dehydratase [Pediococcus siamensis]|uniref:NAD(P)H-hydrate dehydratase n=1 Tax=Pediococcus siamensis TaxID=381829 RepID=UPI0039A3DD73